MPEMITKRRAGPISKSVLLFSGGLDSLCAAQLLKPDVLLYVPGSRSYVAQERAAVMALARTNAIRGSRLAVLPEHVLDLSAYERDDMIVPNRNAHLVLLASNYGDHIVLSSVYGDRSADKDLGFFELMTGLLDHMWSEQHWTTQRHFLVESPFKSVTKTELVQRYLAAGGRDEHLMTSYSCYGGSARHCGVCKPCARKCVALINNDVVPPPQYFAGCFWETEWFASLYPLMREGRYRGKEDADFLHMLTKIGVCS